MGSANCRKTEFVAHCMLNVMSCNSSREDFCMSTVLVGEVWKDIWRDVRIRCFQIHKNSHWAKCWNVSSLHNTSLHITTLRITSLHITLLIYTQSPLEFPCFPCL